MKRLLITLLTALCIGFGLRAQSSADINALFKDFVRKDGTATHTIIRGSALSGTGLNLYRSLGISGSPALADSISARVVRCGAKAESREVQQIDGKIYYAQYTLPRIASERGHRYLFYLNSHLKGGNNQLIIYMTGSASLEQIKRLINQK